MEAGPAPSNGDRPDVPNRLRDTRGQEPHAVPPLMIGCMRGEHGIAVSTVESDDRMLYLFNDTHPFSFICRAADPI